MELVAGTSGAQPPDFLKTKKDELLSIILFFGNLFSGIFYLK